MTCLLSAPRALPGARVRLSAARSAALFAALFVAACAPGSCQGAADTQLNKQRVDRVDAVRKCEGLNTEFIGDVNITSQRELEELEGCQLVRGAIIIEGSTDIVDLAPLAALEEIDDGYFLALNNSALTVVDLPELEIVDYGVGVIDNPLVTAVSFGQLGTQDTEGATLGDITIRANPELTTLQFPNVQQIKTDVGGSPGSLIVGDNPRLASLQGLSSLETIEGVLLLFNNDALPNLTGLEALNEILNTGNAAQALAIGIDFDDAFNIVDAGNDALTTLQGLNELDTVNGDIVIGFNDALQDLDGLDDLAVIDDDLFIIDNDALENLSGLEGDNDGDGEGDGLSVVNGNVFIGLFFDRFGQPVAGGNDSLQDLTGLNSLVTLGGSLVLAFNQELESLAGLELLPAIGGDLVLVGSRQLETFEDAELLSTIGGDLVFGQLFSNTGRIITAGNGDDVVDAELDEMGDVAGVPVGDTGCAIDLAADFTTAFPALTSVAGDLIIASSDFDTLAIAPGLTTVGGRFVLHDAAQPANLSGLEAVTSMGGLIVGLAVDAQGNLIPSGNSAFDAFTGLAVTDLGLGGFAIGFNDELDSFATLPAINTVAGDVTVAVTNVTTLDDVNIATIGGDLRIGVIENGDAALIDAGLDDLTALNLNELLFVGGDVRIAFNDVLADTTLLALGTVVGTVEVTASNALETLSGLGNLTSVGALSLHDLEALTTVTLPGLTATVGDVHIVNNENLETVGLNSLVTVGGTLELRALPVDALGTLSQLTTVGDLATATGDLVLADLVDLNDTAGFVALQSVGGSFVLRGAESLNDTAFAALTQVGGSVELSALQNVEDLEGFETLTSVGAVLRIEDNDNLVTLKGLEGLTTIGRALSLINNSALDIVVRDEDVQDQIDNVDGIDDQGLVFLAQVGNPDFEGVGGERGVIEARDNPEVLEEDLITIAEDFVDNFEGFFLFCGNEDSGQDPDVPSTADCPG